MTLLKIVQRYNEMLHRIDFFFFFEVDKFDISNIPKIYFNKYQVTANVTVKSKSIFQFYHC